MSDMDHRELDEEAPEFERQGLKPSSEPEEEPEPDPARPPGEDLEWRGRRAVRGS